MKKYDTYKDSGVEWIGEIPEHWSLKPLKHIVECNSESLPENTPKNQLINYIEIGDVSADQGITGFEKYEFEKAPSRARRIVKEGDVIISTVRTYLKAIASIERQFDNYVVSTGFAVLTPKEFDSTYLNNIVLSNGFIGEIISLSKGVSYPSITSSDLLQIKVPFPSFLEQEDIGAYLDQKTTEIDTLIAKKEQLIKLLEEERTAMINQAVTKGLDPNVPMKDSDIDWLGEIPEHWEVKKLKYLLKENKDSLKTGPFGSHIKNSDYIANSDFKVYTQRNVLDKEFNNGCEFISEEKFNDLKGFKVYSQDILITTRGSIGRCVEFPENQTEGVLHPCLIRIQINEEKCLKQWAINYINNTSLFYNNVKYNSNSTIIDVIYGYTLKEIVFPVPPVEEQNLILENLNCKLDILLETVNKIQQEINLLKEYKTALISEVVTGKIDIRLEVLN